MFQTHVDHSKVVTEATSYLEIFNYAVSWGPIGSGRRAQPGPGALTDTLAQDPSLNYIEEHPLTADEFENFLNRRVRTTGVLALPLPGEGGGPSSCLSSIECRFCRQPVELPRLAEAGELELSLPPARRPRLRAAVPCLAGR